MTFYSLAIVFILIPEYLSLHGLSSTPILLLLVFILFYTFIFPSAISYYLKKQGFIESLSMENLKDRPLPLFITAIIYLILAYFIYTKSPSFKFTSYIIGTNGVIILLVGLISLRYQISAHLAGASGLLSWLLIFYFKYSLDMLFLPILFSVILIGLIASVRLKLNAHTLNQVFYGMLVSPIIIIVISKLLM
jgi:hypothetical protein